MARKQETSKSHDKITGLIQETSNAYTLYHESGYANGDYADFAALSLNDFKELLRNPNLTRRKLSKMLRRGTNEHRDNAPKSCWANFVAGYIKDVSNVNVKKPKKKH